MATKKTSTRRKSAKVSGLPKSKKFGGKTYTKKGCSRLKTEAKKRAKTLRGQGKNARVVKNPKGGYCVYSRG